MDQDETWHACRPRPWPHCVRWKPIFPSAKGHSPQFSAHMLWPNGWMDQHGTWHGGRPQPNDFALDGYPVPSLKGGGAPKFSAHVYCDQTDGWMKLILGMVVGLNPGDFVLHGDPAPLPQKRAEPPYPIFGPFLLWPNGWMHQDATWYGCRPQPRGLCVRCPPPQKGQSPLPNFKG